MKLDLKELIAKLTSTPIVVEEGTSGIWKYRKWSNGTAECWGYYSKTVSIPAGGHVAVNPPALPSIFNDLPVVETSGGGTANPSIFTTYCKSYISGANYGVDVYLRNQGGSAFNDTGWVYITAKGTWK